jgi:GAF domain-containing protein
VPIGRLLLTAREIVSEKKDKPAFDEQTLAKVLEAAYLLQEHNRELREMELRVDSRVRAQDRGQSVRTAPASSSRTTSADTAPKDDYTAILAQIVDTQHKIQVRHLDLDRALSLIVERVAEITRAGGAGIGILNGRSIRYRAAAGAMAVAVGSEVRIEKALCSACVRVGDVLRCADVNPEFLIDADECRRRGIQSMIAVPVYHNGQTAGGLEVYYADTSAFTEPDVHTCQLMAGLVTEALARNDELAWKTSLATERAGMVEALEKLKPNLAAVADTAGTREAAPIDRIQTPLGAPVAVCLKCGHDLVGEEQFCGECGTPRSGDYGRPSMQSKVASMMQMLEATKRDAAPPTNGSFGPEPPAPSTRLSDRPLADSAEKEMPELFQLPEVPSDELAEHLDPPNTVAAQEFATIAEPDLRPRQTRQEEDSEEEEQDQGEGELEVPETALVKVDQRGHWNSAAAARAFLEQLAGGKRSGALARFLTARRGDFYLAVALILVAGVIRWGIWSNHSVSATASPAAAAAHRKSPASADLPLFDRMLVKLGLAEAPEPPEDKGNPNTQVWVDLRTALYYCPGADLYGKTPKGKFSTQREAQLDQFEPAYRKTCN